MDLGPHAVFIWASYAAVTVTIGGLIAWIVYDGANQRAALAELEDRGVRRRGGKPTGTSL